MAAAKVLEEEEGEKKKWQIKYKIQNWYRGSKSQSQRQRPIQWPHKAQQMRPKAEVFCLKITQRIHQNPWWQVWEPLKELSFKRRLQGRVPMVPFHLLCVISKLGQMGKAESAQTQATKGITHNHFCSPEGAAPWATSIMGPVAGRWHHLLLRPTIFSCTQGVCTQHCLEGPNESCQGWRHLKGWWGEIQNLGKALVMSPWCLPGIFSHFKNNFVFYT
jgi:hypothetical protein